MHAQNCDKVAARFARVYGCVLRWGITRTCPRRVGIITGSDVTFSIPHNDTTVIFKQLNVEGTLQSDGPGTIRMQGLLSGGNMVIRNPFRCDLPSSRRLICVWQPGITGGGDSGDVGHDHPPCQASIHPPLPSPCTLHPAHPDRPLPSIPHPELLCGGFLCSQAYFNRPTPEQATSTSPSATTTHAPPPSLKAPSSLLCPPLSR